jgi:hypothetical protein
MLSSLVEKLGRLSFWGAEGDEESLYLFDFKNTAMLRFAQHDRWHTFFDKLSD